MNANERQCHGPRPARKTRELRSAYRALRTAYRAAGVAHRLLARLHRDPDTRAQHAQSAQYALLIEQGLQAEEGKK